MALAALFGRRKTPEEMLRQNQRALNKVSRDQVWVLSSLAGQTPSARKGEGVWGQRLTKLVRMECNVT